MFLGHSIKDWLIGAGFVLMFLELATLRAKVRSIQGRLAEADYNRWRGNP